VKAARKRHQVTYKGKPVIISADLSAEDVKDRRIWANVFQVLKQNKCRDSYNNKLSFKIDEQKIFHDKIINL
jgi:hypothetical protein